MEIHRKSVNSPILLVNTICKLSATINNSVYYQDIAKICQNKISRLNFNITINMHNAQQVAYYIHLKCITFQTYEKF